jgi:polyhydroxyalkanoate synthesis regulator phasin
MINLDELNKTLLNGYTDQQYSEANFNILLDFLVSKKLINTEEFSTFRNNNIEKAVEAVKEKDKKIEEKRREESLKNIEALRKKIRENNDGNDPLSRWLSKFNKPEQTKGMPNK